MIFPPTLQAIAEQNAAMRQALDVIRENEFLRDTLAARGVAVEAPVQSMAAITECVGARYSVTVARLRGREQTRDVAWPRQEAMWLMRQVTAPNGAPRFSLPQIGRYFNRDHTTVLHALRSHEARRALAQQEAEAA